MKILNVQQHPVLAELSLGRVSLQYSRHALDRAREKDFYLPRAAGVVIGAGAVVEIERENNKTVKLVTRIGYNTDWDLVMVLVPREPGLFWVKSVWLNQVTDNHASLNQERLVG